MSLAGTRLGVYEVLSQLGAGGMGEVYRARDTKLGRDVAIKILPSSVAADPERLARFEREARVLASLNHPNIGAIYGLEETAGITALVLELVEGATLAERIANGGQREGRGLPLGESLAIARQIADALDAAHERGIVHRDLKPANIIITPDGTVKVLDFGLAKPSGAGPIADDLANSPTMIAPTLDGVLLGTAPYMSPEQARGKAVDKRTDIWAFGSVLFEMLTGRRAFAGETTSDTIASILEREPDWSALPAQTPPMIARLLKRCTEKDAKRRLRDVADARLDLDDAMIGAPAFAGPIAVHRPNRERIAWAAAAMLFVALIAAVLPPLVGRSPASEDSAPVVSRVRRLTSGPAFEAGAAISPDGKWVAFLSDARGPTDVWVQFVAGGEPVNLTASTNLEIARPTDIGGLAISPDGSSIAVDAAPRGAGPPAVAAWIIPAPLGGMPRKFLERGRAMRWSLDGTKILYVVAGGITGDALWVADADGGNAREVAPRRGGIHKHWPAWSPDGRYIYFNHSITTTNTEPTQVYRVPAAGGAIEPVVTTTRRAVFPNPTPDGHGIIYSANPQTTDSGLWWKSLRGNAPSQRLTTGIGEYAEPSIAADGRSLVSTLFDVHQALVAVLVADGAIGKRIDSLTNGYTGDLDPAFSRDGNRMVFSSARSGNRNLWIARPDGTEARPLTATTAIDERPVFSPDGQQIAFVSDRGGDRGIWAMSADGGTARLLVRAPVLDVFSWSPDGRRIVYAIPGEQPELWLVTVNDGETRRLTTPGSAAAPAWSPTGDVIAYIGSTSVGPTNVTTARIGYVTADGRAVHTDAPPITTLGNGTLAWSADGTRLAAIGNSGSAASVALIVDPQARMPPNQVFEFPADVRLRGLTWSPDGSSLIIGQQRRTGDIVWLDLAK